MRFRFLWLVLSLCWVSLASADTLDDVVRANMAAEHIPGVAVGIMVGEELKVVRTYGFANLETQTPVTENTVFRIASMSKAFAAAAALKLIEEGKLSLETRVVDMLPDAPEAWKDIRVKHLLSHTSGIPDSDLFDMTRPYTESQFLALFWRLPLDSEPGAVYRYNNFGYSTLGLVVKRASGQSLRDFVTERILKPLDMTATHYYDLPRIVPHRANGYLWQNGAHVNALPLRPEVYDGSGGMLTSVVDYAKWQAALHKNQPLSDSIKTQQWTQFTLNDGKPGPYGFGWFPSVREGQRVVNHGGATFGFTSHVIRNLDTDITIFVFRNGSGGNVGAFTTALLAEYTRLRGQQVQ